MVSYNANAEKRIDDLIEGALKEEELRKFIGGSGLGAKFLFELTGQDTDPLGEENVIIFMAGPLTGTKAFSSDRFEVITKSPLTGIYAESDCGGRWGSMLKRSGYDGIIIEGMSASPVYIWINDKDIKILDASCVWGLDTFDAYKKLKELLNQDLEKKLLQEKEIKRKTKKNYQQAYKQIKKHPQLTSLVKLAQELIYLQTYRLDVFFLSYFYVYQLFEEIGKRLNLKAQEVVYLTGEEIIDYLDKKSAINYREIKNRMNKYALILEKGKFTQFGVRLPVSRSSRLPEEYGTRHHAAMGLAEKSDALAVVVSEERGKI